MKALRLLSLLCIIAVAVSMEAAAEREYDITLLKPQIARGRKLMFALEKRKTTRSFGEKDLSLDILSNLLWAAAGVNRPATGHLTAPSAYNWQEVDIYVAMKNGLYLYSAGKHTLIKLKNEDIREFTAVQNFTQSAPVNLVYVADFADMVGNENDKLFFAAADSGCISENVYLFCASEGLATALLASIEKPKLTKLMGLRKDQRIIFSQPIGYPSRPGADE